MRISVLQAEQTLELILRDTKLQAQVAKSRTDSNYPELTSADIRLSSINLYFWRKLVCTFETEFLYSRLAILLLNNLSLSLIRSKCCVNKSTNLISRSHLEVVLFSFEAFDFLDFQLSPLHA